MPNAKPAIAPRARPARRSFARAGRLTIAAGPGAGTTTSPAWWKRRLSTPPGWNACRTAFRTARPRRPYERSAIWTSPNFRRSFRRAASAGIDHPSLTLTHVMHRDLPRPSLRATPKALRYGRGSLLCMTWISSRPPPMRGHDWTRKGGRNWKRFDSGGESLGQHGLSKDHRPDLCQVVVGVVLDEAGRPICSETWPGNATDVKSLLPVVTRLRDRFGIRHMCVVADRGMISADTIAELEARGIDYILGARERSTSEVREVVLADREPMVPLTIPRARGSEIDIEVKEVIAGDWGPGTKPRRYVVCFNPAEARRDAAAREATVASLRS